MLTTRGVPLSIIRQFHTYLDIWATIRFRDDYFYYGVIQYDSILIRYDTIPKPVVMKANSKLS